MRIELLPRGYLTVETTLGSKIEVPTLAMLDELF